MGSTRIVGDRGQEDIGAVDDWFEGDSVVSVPELVADLDDSFHELEIADQGKEATAVEEAQGEDPIDRESHTGSNGEGGESGGEGDEGYEYNEEEWAALPARGVSPLSIKSLTLYRQLGEGGFGQVYAASLEDCDKVHAVKVIPKTEGNKDQVSREQDLLRRLIGCPFFTQLEASWQSSLNYYLVTPVYPGNLRDEIEKYGGLSIDVAHFYIKQILGAVDYLHSHYILHRDLKLENILLTQDGHAVVCDFGLATIVLPNGRARRSFEEDPDQDLPSFYVENLTYCFGTPQSTAPEIVLGQAYGLSSDMWSLGVIIYEMITGRLPWSDEYGNATALYKSIIATDPGFVPSEWLDDAGLCLIAHRLLRKDPSRRPSINELLFSHVFQEL
ncbi:kinase-like protein [Thelephora ganbajun]|uniref:Kinase-like protein n=1 Tax=Thelephora ganbajun TaxID=370292 RepID=A0ACB6ZP20_THEGA|nr:kinase-like protein [Thelephora ganbajun]